MDIYTESTVSRSLCASPRAVKRFFLILTCAAIALALLHLAFLFLALIFLLMFLWCRSNLEVEFDYIHANDELDIDKVIMGKRRKHILTVHLGQVLLLAPKLSDALDPYQTLPVMDLSSMSGSRDCYVMVCVANNMQRRLILELDEKMLNSLKTRIRDVMILE